MLKSKLETNELQKAAFVFEKKTGTLLKFLNTVDITSQPVTVVKFDDGEACFLTCQS